MFAARNPSVSPYENSLDDPAVVLAGGMVTSSVPGKRDRVQRERSRCFRVGAAFRQRAEHALVSDVTRYLREPGLSVVWPSFPSAGLVRKSLPARQPVPYGVYHAFLPDLVRCLLVYQTLLPGLVHRFVYQALLFFLLSLRLAGFRSLFVWLASFFPRPLRLAGLPFVVDRLSCQLLLVDRSSQRLISSG